MKNRHFFLYFSFFFLILPLDTWALEGMDSGGGKGIVCFKSAATAEAVKNNLGVIDDTQLTDINFLEPLDLYFAKMKMVTSWGLEPAVPHLLPEKDFPHYSELYLFLKNRLQEDFPEIYQAIDASERTFHESEIVWSNMAIGPIFDENMPNVISGPLCLLTTFAIQFRENEVDFLHIDERLFFHPLQSKMGQATLLLHEFLYLTARNNGSVNSRSVRHLIRFLLREKLEKEKIARLSKGLGLRP